jgi:hypothetical protein
MSPHRRSVVAILVWQVVLGLFALGFCYAITKRSQIYSFGPPHLTNDTNRWCGSLYRGEPVPWAEYNETRYDLGDPFPVAHNLAVPACMFLLAIGMPPLVVAEWDRRRLAADPLKRSRSRRVRALWVVFLTAGTGWTTALLDVVTDPVSTAWHGIGRVPFAYAPGSWFLVQDSPPTPAWDSEPIKWLRKKRGELMPPEPGSGYDQAVIPREWDRRTDRTLAGMGIGLVCGCVLFRPWRRNPLSGKLDVDGKSCPSC